MIKNILSSATNLIRFEDVYDVKFGIYDRTFWNMIRTRAMLPIGDRLRYYICMHAKIVIDFINYGLILSIAILLPIHLVDKSDVINGLFIALILMQAFMTSKLPKIWRYLFPIVVIEVLVVVLLFIREHKLSKYDGEINTTRSKYMCVSTKSFGNFADFDECDRIDKRYIWFCLFAGYATILAYLYVYIRGITTSITFTLSAYYAELMKQFMKHNVLLEITHIKRNPAVPYTRMSLWAYKSYETLHTDYYLVTVDLLNAMLDDVVRNVEAGKLQLKSVKFGLTDPKIDFGKNSV